MDFTWGRARYTSRKIKDVQQGYEGFELVRQQDGADLRVASVVFWDATGQFWVETFGTDIPLQVLEELIAETKEKVRIR
ncbi:hypothetical protein [Urbifossiella limnaea]|uniref:Uncharacterized protein n=1 Tax=Urbifossiella limnaea TaxID=2528023 RepID=A0A517XUH0_9BACT|nr:hypothetical protein [Urbifossiella limnaea]QDU21158.1 hypothetical protein ETAA1_31230 [Urbifossiella limnaea]